MFFFLLFFDFFLTIRFPQMFRCFLYSFRDIEKQPPEVFCKKRRATLLKKRLWHRCFSVNFAKFLRTPFLQNTSGRLLLDISVLSCKNLFLSVERFIIALCKSSDINHPWFALKYFLFHRSMLV